MADPFRDQLTAALERVAELEATNEELRVRVDSAEGARKESDTEARTAVSTSHALVTNLQRENAELRDDGAKAQKAVWEVRHAEIASAKAPRKRVLSVDIGMFMAGAFAGVLFGIIVGHC